jgi:hypothetical protein
MTLWDTSGLNEVDKGMVAAKNDIVNLHKLIRGLEVASWSTACVDLESRGTQLRNTKCSIHSVREKFPLFW